MKNSILGALVAVLLVGIAYRIGQNQPLVAAADRADASYDRVADRAPHFADGAQLMAQGRGTRVPPKPRSDKPAAAPAPLVFGGDGGGGSASSNGFMAVTGSYGVGTSVLYLIDTNTQQLLVYEARGGSQSMRRLVLVGARRIDLDLQLIDYNDESEYKRSDLVRLFQGGAKKPKGTGVTVPGESGVPLGTGKFETTNTNSKSVKKRDGR